MTITKITAATLHYSTVTTATDINPVKKTASWDEFVSLFERPEIKERSVTLKQYLAMPVDKKRRIKDGTAWLPAIFDGKRKDENVTQLCAWAIDFDEGDQTESILRDVIEAQAFIAIGHTSFSHHPDKPKWRVIVPFNNPITPDKLPLITRYFFDLFGAASCDEKCTNPGRLFYLPSCLPDAERFYQFFETGGDLFDVEAVLETYQPIVKTIEQEALNAPLAQHSMAKLVDGSRSPIDEFNAAHSVHEVLTSAGYRKIGKRYLSPFSESGMPGVVILKADDGKECAYSHHGNDPLSDGKRHDAFDCYALLTCSGDIKTALNWNPELTRHNQRVYMEQLRLEGIAPDISETAKQVETETTSAGKKPMFVPLSELLARPAPTKWLVRDYLEMDSTVLLFGESGAGKSFMAVDLALSVATGTDWHGHEIRQGSVFYVAGEGHGGFAKRFAAWGESNEVDVSAAPLFLSTAAIGLPDEPTLQALIQNIDNSGHKPSLIVFDTLARSLIGDENSAKDVGAFVQAIDRIRARYNCCILTVHHTGHGNGDRARGSSALRAAMDTELGLINGDQGIKQLSVTKQKNHEPYSEKFFRLETAPTPWADDDGQPINSAVLVIDETIKAANAKPKKRLNHRDDAILTALHRAIADHGISPPLEIKERFGGFDGNLNAHRKVVDIEHWRNEAYPVIDSEDESKRTLFTRARNKLRDMGLVQTMGNQWWIIADEIKL